MAQLSLRRTCLFTQPAMLSIFILMETITQSFSSCGSVEELEGCSPIISQLPQSTGLQNPGRVTVCHSPHQVFLSPCPPPPPPLNLLLALLIIFIFLFCSLAFISTLFLCSFSPHRIFESSQIHYSLQPRILNTSLSPSFSLLTSLHSCGACPFYLFI